MLKSNFIYLKFKRFCRKKEFLDKFSISYSSFYSMEKYSLKNHKKDSRNIDIAAYSDKIDDIILETIKSWVRPPQYLLTLDKIWLFINNKIGISVNKRKVKELLKILLNYSSKIGSSGSKVLKSDRNKIQTSVFSSWIFLNIYNDKLILMSLIFNKETKIWIQLDSKRLHFANNKFNNNRVIKYDLWVLFKWKVSMFMLSKYSW